MWWWFGVVVVWCGGGLVWWWFGVGCMVVVWCRSLSSLSLFLSPSLPPSLSLFLSLWWFGVGLCRFVLVEVCATQYRFSFFCTQVGFVLYTGLVCFVRDTIQV